MKKIISAVLAATIVLAPISANATGWPVFDYANFYKNTITSAQSVKSYAQQTSQYMTQLMQYKQQMINSIKAPIDQFNQAVAPLKQQYAQMKQAYDAVQRVYGTAKSIQQQYEYRVRDLKAFGKGGWKEYVMHEAQMSAQNHQNNQQAFQREMELMDRLQQEGQAANDAVGHVSEMQGHMEAMQGMNVGIQQLRAGQAQLTEQIAYANLHQHDQDMQAQAKKDSVDERAQAAKDLLDKKNAAINADNQAKQSSLDSYQYPF